MSPVVFRAHYVLVLSQSNKPRVEPARRNQQSQCLPLYKKQGLDSFYDADEINEC